MLPSSSSRVWCRSVAPFAPGARAGNWAHAYPSWVEVTSSMCEVLADRLIEWDVASIAHASMTVENVAVLLQDARDDSAPAPHAQNQEAHV